MKNNNETLDRLNKDLSLEDVRPWWRSNRVELWDHDFKKPMAEFSTETESLQREITAWCVKNNYRCSAIHDGKIWL